MVALHSSIEAYFAAPAGEEWPVQPGVHAYLQPQVCLNTGKVVGAEALARFVGSDGRVVPPAEFLPIVDQQGLHDDLLQRMIHRVSLAIRELSPFPHGFRVSVNVDASSLNWHLPRNLRKYLPEAGVRPETLAFELTETSVLQDVDMSVTVISAIRDMGIRVYIDDFGTGHSSLGVLRKLPIDGIKVPREFVQHCHRDKDLKILFSICRMLKDLNIHAVAEGVETQEQRSLLELIGCGTAQGFYFSPPVPTNEFPKFL